MIFYSTWNLTVCLILLSLKQNQQNQNEECVHNGNMELYHAVSQDYAIKPLTSSCILSSKYLPINTGSTNK